MGRICLYAGSASSPNVGRLLTNLYGMLDGPHRVEIVGGRLYDLTLGVPSLALEHYDSTTVRGGARALAEYTRQAEPSVLVQVTNPPIHGTVVGAVARATSTAAVYRYSGDRFYEYRVARGLDRASEFAVGSVLGRLPLAMADSYISLGPVGRRRLIARGVPPREIEVLPPTIDPAPFETATPASVDVPAERDVALFVGRVSHRKGKQTLEAAIPQALDRRPNLQFVCVGQSDTGLDIPPVTRDHVTAVGKVAPDAVPRYMQAADLLVHPSLTDGIPRVVLESLAAGTPVLARDVGDVASVTDNTFKTTDEFVDRLCEFESLPLDDVDGFTPSALAGEYQQFFGQFG